MGSDLGYDMELPSKPPFMWIESERAFNTDNGEEVRVIAFGAFNAKGLIGPEKGGVAVVNETRKAVIATKDIPYDPAQRAVEVTGLIGLVEHFMNTGPKVNVSPDELMHFVRCRQYVTRV